MPHFSATTTTRLIAVLSLLSLYGKSLAMGLMIEPSSAHCGLPIHAQSTAQSSARFPAQQVAPIQTAKHLPNSQVVKGSKDMAWVWLGTPTMRYPHKALGESTHAGSLHALLNSPTGKLQELVHELPFNRVFEDRVPRLVDLDGDGRDEIILIESDALRGSATVVYGVEITKLANGAVKKTRLVERARSAQTGSTFRWLNPVGAADFDGDGKLDIASVITPHIGGLLTLYHYAPPKLEPFAQAMDTSNHRMGDLEQQVAVIVEQKGLLPTVIVPDMQLKALHALRWDAPGQWKELADVKPLPATVKRITPLPNGGCVLLTDATWWRVWLTS